LARDGLTDAHDRYDDAVLKARQELHRRYRGRVKPKPGATMR
jgi:hypothetical protein